MPCTSACQDTAQHFGDRWAHAELAGYRKTGARKTTRAILAGLKAVNARPASALDVGAGIGILAFELLQGGVESATCVDISTISQSVGAEEAQRLGLADQIDWRAGDFVALAGTIPPADLVTLDRVVCCYSQYQDLLREAAGHSRRYVALSYPRDRWYMYLGLWLENGWRRVIGDPFRAFQHPVSLMLAVLEEAGMQRVHLESMLGWEIAIFAYETSNVGPAPVGLEST